MSDPATVAISIPDAISAISGLGAASFGLVDALKLPWGFLSNAGFWQITGLLDHLFAPDVDKADRRNPITYGSIAATLRANWLNGAALADQKSIAKTLIKLRLDANDAEFLAGCTGVDPDLLKSLAEKYGNGGALTPEEQNVAGRFDLMLSTLIDQAYQRADQIYRNSSKVAAMIVSVALALAGNASLGDVVPPGTALIVGLLAAPLAPVGKDLASALQASVKTLQFFKK